MILYGLATFGGLVLTAMTVSGVLYVWWRITDRPRPASVGCGKSQLDAEEQ